MLGPKLGKDINKVVKYLSNLDESFGISISSYGPEILLVAFMKTIGSVGVLAPVSFAWSE